MRPPPRVTVLQYFLISFPQELSSFWMPAVSFARTAFIVSPCANAALGSVTPGGSIRTIARMRRLIFIDCPLKTSFGQRADSKAFYMIRRRATGVAIERNDQLFEAKPSGRCAIAPIEE